MTIFCVQCSFCHPLNSFTQCSPTTHPLTFTSVHVSSPQFILHAHTFNPHCLITLKMHGEEWKLWSSSLYSFYGSIWLSPLWSKYWTWQEHSQFVAFAEVETPIFTPLQNRMSCCCQHHAHCMAVNALKGAVNWKPPLSWAIVAICSPASLKGCHWNRNVFISKEKFLLRTAQ